MKKKYRVLKEMPWIEKGEEFEVDEQGHYYIETVKPKHICYIPEELTDLVKNGWIEEVSDRIELHRTPGSVRRTIMRKDGIEVSKKQIKLMEQAINGELFTKEEETTIERFNNWLKDKQK